MVKKDIIVFEIIALVASFILGAIGAYTYGDMLLKRDPQFSYCVYFQSNCQPTYKSIVSVGSSLGNMIFIISFALFNAIFFIMRFIIPQKRKGEMI